MVSQLQATTPESDRKSDVSADAFDESTFFLHSCCCTEHPDSDRSWWSDGVDAFKKAREWSGKFQYDPCSYALNFAQGPGQNGQFEDDDAFRDFPSRYEAIPAQNSLLKDGDGE
ncbi:hypothetical protein SASPL_146486 [Salvia splendens]|uniref:Uncharacterized protein n=1 Tax=Salvia splendens TaxID=180675 RepID=A0A8X8WC80_SALSN|nr:hypothetical protein SASPL_146486 [Salvia splendens]